jgi:hypothetical protein
MVNMVPGTIFENGENGALVPGTIFRVSAGAAGQHEALGGSAEQRALGGIGSGAAGAAIHRRVGNRRLDGHALTNECGGFHGLLSCRTSIRHSCEHGRTI